MVLGILSHSSKLKEIINLIFFLYDETSDVKSHLVSFEVGERNRFGSVYPTFVKIIFLLLGQASLVLNDFFELFQKLKLFYLLVSAIV